METKCNRINCETTFDRSNIICAYCACNPTDRVDNFRSKVPKINNEDWNVEFNSFDVLIKKGFSWNMEKADNNADGSNRNLVIYLEDITLTTPLSKASCMLDWDKCKERIAEHYNLPL